MTAFPSLSDLVWHLFYLTWYSIGYKLGTNPWAKVQEYQTKLSNWFGQFKQWAIDAWSAADAVVKAYAKAWIDYLEAWRSYLAGKVSSAWTWIDNTAAAVVTWVNTYKEKLASFADYIYYWLAWFWGNPAYAIGYYLGAAWAWLKAFYASPGATIRALLGAAWTWLASFYANPWAIIEYYLGSAWDWLVWFWSNTAAAIAYYLGAAWSWLVWFWSNTAAAIAAYLGAPWTWLLSLWGLNRDALLAFIRDALVFWYNVWSLYRTVLIAFLKDPGGFILAAIREIFLDWLTQLVADNW